MFSPSFPRRGDDDKTSFSSVNIPWLLMTGTNDEAIIGGATADSRREVYPALSAGNKYELVLYKAEHSAFGDRALPNEKEPRNPNHHKAILAISTAFFDAYLRDNNEAKKWVGSNAVRDVLEEDDIWQWK
jgi:hypothetical protein